MSLSQQQNDPNASRKGKKTTAFQKNKEAFDTVVKHFVRMDRPVIGPPGVMNMAKASGSRTSQNPVAPSPVDFRSDVLLAVKAAMPRGVRLANFILAYFLYDSEDDIERGRFAAKILGGRMHSVEQRVGAEFVRRAIWPEAVYFHPPRLIRRRNVI